MALPLKHKRRLLPGLLGVTLLAALAFVPPAAAASDPIRAGTARLKLSEAFKKQLKRQGVSMTPTFFEVVGGAIDPATGGGSLRLAGRISFEHRGTEAKLGKVRATLGTGGVLRAGRVRLFRLGAGTVSRNGFGTDLRGVKLTFLKSGARSLNRKLDMHSLHAGKAGTLTASVVPLTLGVVSGTASVQPSLAAGSFISKLAAHCVNPTSGLSAIPPATQPGGPNTPIFLPITSGELSPIGMAGVISQAGGIQFDNGGAGLPAGCPVANDVTIRMIGLSGDLNNRVITGTALASGPGSPLGSLGLEVGTLVEMPIDISDTWFNPDPANLSVASNGSVVRLDAFSAANLNSILAQPPPADPSMEFRAGDLFGTTGISVKLR